MKMTSEFEIFSDPLHYDMWCLRRKSDRDFNMTLHFNTKNQAEHARAVIQEWVKAELEACAKLCESLRPSEQEYDQRFYTACTLCAAAIRARGE